MNKTSYPKLFSILLPALILAPQVLAQTAEEKGFGIAARNDRSERGFGNSRVSLKMILRSEACGALQCDVVERIPAISILVTVNNWPGLIRPVTRFDV